jgi:DNA-binding CsgD family transcriptional regulator
MSKLGPSQRKTIKLLIRGFTPKEIAFKRGIAHGTAVNHTMRARRRLGYRTVEQMMYELGKEA